MKTAEDIVAERDRAAVERVLAELTEARKNFPPINSHHEGYAVVKEEVDEYWDEVKINQRNRNPRQLLKELIQTAAMAIRTIVDVEGELL